MIRSVSCGSGPLLAAEHLGDDLVFSRSRPDFQPLVVLELADLRDDLGAAIQQADQVQIKPVNLVSQTRKTRLTLVFGRLRGGSPILRGTGRLIAC